MFLICLLILFKTQSQAEPLLFECYNTINMYEYGFFFLSHFHLLHWNWIRPFHFKISSNIRHAHAHNHMYECKSSRSSLSKSFIVCIELWSENINGFFHIACSSIEYFTKFYCCCWNERKRKVNHKQFISMYGLQNGLRLNGTCNDCIMLSVTVAGWLIFFFFQLLLKHHFFQEHVNVSIKQKKNTTRRNGMLEHTRAHTREVKHQ